MVSSSQSLNKQNLTKPAKTNLLVGFQSTLDFLFFVLGRLAFGIIVLFVVAYITHFGLDMARGIEFQEAIPHAAALLLKTIQNVISGDLGLSTAATSTLNPIPVIEAFPGMFKKSLGLLGASLVFSSLVGVALGILTAQGRNQAWSTLMTIFSILGVSIPSFFAALILQRLVIHLTQTYGFRILPIGGFGWDKHLVLPMLVLAARPIAQIARVSFVSIRETIRQDYVLTARSKGLSETWVMWKHVMRNAAIPIVTTIGLSLRFSLSSLPVVEAFFGWSGLGFFLLKGISQQDDNLTVVLVLCLGTLFILVNLLIDMIYRVLDPRLRKKVERVGLGNQKNRIKMLRDVVDLDLLRDVIRRRVLFWILRQPFHKAETDESDKAFPHLSKKASSKDYEEETHTESHRRRIYPNLALVLGVGLVLILLILTFGGHRLTPNSPYTTRGLKIEEGEFLVPPFEPNEEFMWGTDVLGRDIASLIIAGTWQTMRLAAMVVVIRLFLGFLLGAIAGWKSETWIDRFISGLAETLFAFPPLLFAMILILALGIRKGIMPFVVALSCVGWGEVMQYVRGEVMAMRPKTFIEGAVSVGRRVSGIITHHVLPNLVPTLIPIAALEMGAVLMLLGELGYVGVFIGGGAFVELDIDAAPYHYSDVPEWGALLSNVRLFALTYPWTAIYPAVAFFVAIAGFNLFGEGIRRLISDEGVRIHRILNRYTLIISILVLTGLTWLRGATGSISIYARQAEAFSVSNSMRNLQILTSPAFEGRAIGTDGLDTTAEWIASEFEALGLQPAGKTFTYFQPRRRDYEAIDQQPVLEIDDFGPVPVYQQDFSAFPAYFRNLGSAKGMVRFVSFGDLSTGPYGYRHPRLEDLDYSREIVMVLSGLEEALLNEVDRSGVLVVASDPLDLQRNYTYSPRDPHYRPYGSDELLGYDTPVIWISEDLANRILAGTGQTIADLRLASEELEQDEIFELPTHQVVAMEVNGTIYEKVTLNQVIGHWPGEAGFPGHQMDNRLIVVMAKYDSPPVTYTGEIYPGANDNASGLAIMLEMIRTMKETGYEPNRTILFVAYCGEGAEGGIPAMRPPVSQLLQSKVGFASRLEPEAVVELRGLGAGEGEGIAIIGGGSLRLTNLFEDVAIRVGAKTERIGGDVDLSVIYRTGSSRESAEETPIILLTWDGWEATSQMPFDQIDTISTDKLKQAGEVATLAVMIMGRELDY